MRMKALVLCLVALALVLSVGSAFGYATPSNLLQNPGFENTDSTTGLPTWAPWTDNGWGNNGMDVVNAVADSLGKPLSFYSPTTTTVKCLYKHQLPNRICQGSGTLRGPDGLTPVLFDTGVQYTLGTWIYVPAVCDAAGPIVPAPSTVTIAWGLWFIHGVFADSDHLVWSEEAPVGVWTKVQRIFTLNTDVPTYTSSATDFGNFHIAAGGTSSGLQLSPAYFDDAFYQANYHYLTVRVLDAYGRVPGATVKVGTASDPGAPYTDATPPVPTTPVMTLTTDANGECKIFVPDNRPVYAVANAANHDYGQPLSMNNESVSQDIVRELTLNSVTNIVISGRAVTSALQPVRNAEIQIVQGSTVIDTGVATDSNGQYTAALTLPTGPGAYQVKAVNPNYDPCTPADLNVVHGTVNYSVADIKMDLPAGVTLVNINGTVIDAVTNNPIAGVKVTANDPVVGIDYVTKTNASGHYDMDVYVGGHYAINVDPTQTPKLVMLTPAADRTWTADEGLTQNWTVPLLVAYTGLVTGFDGIVKDSVTQAPIANAIVQVGGQKGTVVVTDTDGRYSFTGLSTDGEIFADALGYHCANLLVSGSGNLTKIISLTPEAETGGIQNGGMETVVDGKPAGWGQVPWSVENWGPGPIDYVASTDAAHGNYSLRITNPSIGSSKVFTYSGCAQKIAVDASYLYNMYFKCKGEAALPEFNAGVNWDGPSGPISSSFCNEGFSLKPSTTWKQYTHFGDAPNDFYGARFALPMGTTSATIFFQFCEQFGTVADGFNVDDVVIDKVIPTPLTVVPADPPLATDVANIAALKAEAVGKVVKLTGNVTVICAPRVTSAGARSTTFFYVAEKQGLGGLRVVDKVSDNLNVGDTVTGLTGTVRKTASGEFYLELSSDSTGSTGTAIKPLGLNNKAAATDAKALTNAVKVWGKVAYTAGANTFTIDDGYNSPITVNVNGVTLPSSFNGKTAVVTGVVTKFSGSLAVEAGEVSAF